MRKLVALILLVGASQAFAGDHYYVQIGTTIVKKWDMSKEDLNHEMADLIASQNDIQGQIDRLNIQLVDKQKTLQSIHADIVYLGVIISSTVPEVPVVP